MDDLVTVWSNDLSALFDAIAHGLGIVLKDVLKVSEDSLVSGKNSTSRIKSSI